ncbi:hypothetical protein Tco_1467554 [Tanacetum coccineum]
MYHNINQLKWHLERENLHSSNPKTRLDVLKKQLKEFFDLKEVNASNFLNKCWQKDFKDYTKWEPETYKSILLCLSTDGQALDASFVTQGTTLKANLSNNNITLEACLVDEVKVMDDSLGPKESIDDSDTSLEQLDESSSSRNECSKSRNEKKGYDHESTSSRNDVDDDIRLSYDNDTMSEVYHDMFENVSAHGIQNHEQPESISDIYMVNENNSNIISNIPNMDPDRHKEEHDYVDYEQHRAFFASSIYNLKCDVEKYNEVNREAQQANALLTNELERYKEKEKHFAKDMTIESEYYKKIKLLNDEISNLKSQACKKDKTFASENEKLRKAGQTDQTLRMLLPKEDNVNTGKQGLGFENQNDDVNPSLLNKDKELAPCVYNNDEMGKDELSDHKIIFEEELKYEAEKRLKVKQRKSPLSYHGFVYGETQFEEPLKVPLKRINVN